MRNSRFALLFTAVWNMLRFSLVFLSTIWLLSNTGLDFSSFFVLWFGAPGLVTSALALFSLIRPDSTGYSLRAIRLLLVLETIVAFGLLILRTLSYLDADIAYYFKLNSMPSIFSPDFVVIIFSIIVTIINIILLSKTISRRREREE